MFKKNIIFIFCFLTLMLPARLVWAGFGVSPTYIKSEILRPGTQYERRIAFLRSSAEEDLEARITITAPEIASWISIDKGLSFVLPEGELRVAATVRVVVPENAVLDHYQGQLSVAVAPAKEWKSGVAVSVGAVIDLDLTVTKDVLADFKIREVKIPDFEYLSKPWNSRFFSWFNRRLRLNIRIENTGNVETAPTKVTLDIFGVPAKTQLESLTSVNIEKVAPYKTEEISVEFPSSLGVGQYWGRVKIYKDSQIIYNDQMVFTVAAPGALSGNSRWRNVWPWLVIILGLLLAASLVVLINRKNFFRWRKFFWVPVSIWRIGNRRLVAAWLEFKYKFWRRLRHKSAFAISKKQNHNAQK